MDQAVSSNFLKQPTYRIYFTYRGTEHICEDAYGQQCSITMFHDKLLGQMAVLRYSNGRDEHPVPANDPRIVHLLHDWQRWWVRY